MHKVFNLRTSFRARRRRRTVAGKAPVKRDGQQGQGACARWRAVIACSLRAVPGRVAVPGRAGHAGSLRTAWSPAAWQCGAAAAAAAGLPRRRASAAAAA